MLIIIIFHSSGSGSRSFNLNLDIIFDTMRWHFLVDSGVNIKPRTKLKPILNVNINTRAQSSP